METILFFNHKQAQCGVYQYGYRSAMILKKSTTYNFVYKEIENEQEYWYEVAHYTPVAVIYNYHPATMGWLNNDNIIFSVFNLGIYHENAEIFNIKFNAFLISDPTFIDKGDKYHLLRPLLETPKIAADGILGILPNVPIIGSFGFGFANKGFDRLVKLVNNEFDEAMIRLHIPFAYYGDREGAQARFIAAECQKHITKDKIQLLITHDFKTEEEIIEFLSFNTLNAFLYDEMMGRGISSAIDYALSVNVPIAITKTYMFRHISHTHPSICVEDKTLKGIINGPDMQSYKDQWSHSNFISRYEAIINNTINKL